MMSSGLITNVEIGEEKTQKDYYDKAVHYDTVWGMDNIHLGYYPHLTGPAAGDNLAVLNNKQAADCLTKRMIDVGRIDYRSKVLDLGCGKGQSVKLICAHTGATCVGIDIGTENIRRANEVASEMPELKMTFYEGSFTELPSEVLAEKFDVIFSQVAFCHVHNELRAILEEAKKVLAPGGVFIVNDYLGCDLPAGASKFTRENVWKRLHFEHLHGHKAWRHICEDANLDIVFYENLDAHMAHTYDDMEKTAREHKFRSADGELLANNYKRTAAAIRAGEVGMNIALMKLGPSKSKL